MRRVWVAADGAQVIGNGAGCCIRSSKLQRGGEVLKLRLLLLLLHPVKQSEVPKGRLVH